MSGDSPKPPAEVVAVAPEVNATPTAVPPPVSICDPATPPKKQDLSSLSASTKAILATLVTLLAAIGGVPGITTIIDKWTARSHHLVFNLTEETTGIEVGGNPQKMYWVMCGTLSDDGSETIQIQQFHVTGGCKDVQFSNDADFRSQIFTIQPFDENGKPIHNVEFDTKQIPPLNWTGSVVNNLSPRDGMLIFEVPRDLVAQAASPNDVELKLTATDVRDRKYEIKFVRAQTNRLLVAPIPKDEYEARPGMKIRKLPTTVKASNPA